MPFPWFGKKSSPRKEHDCEMDKQVYLYIKEKGRVSHADLMVHFESQQVRARTSIAYLKENGFIESDGIGDDMYYSLGGIKK